MYTHLEIPAAYAAKMQVHTAPKPPAQPPQEKPSATMQPTKKGGISPAIVFLLLDLLSEKSV